MASSAQATTEDARPGEVPIFGAQWLPKIEEPLVIESQGERTLVVAGAVRASVERASAVVARDFPLAQIVSAALVGSRWAFVTADGGVFEASSFVGTLRAISQSDYSVERVSRSRGALAWLDHVHRGWVFDGEEVRRWPLEQSTSVAFSSAREGAAITAGGLVRWTTDGGRSDRIVALGERVAFEVRGDSGALVVRTSDGWLRIDPQGALQATAPTLAPEASLAQTEAILRAIYRRWPAALYVNEPRYRPLGDEVVVAVDRTLFWFDARDGALLRRAINAMPSGACVPTAWGPKVVIDCPQSLGRFVFDPSRPLAPLGRPAGTRELFLSSDGAFALSVRPCEGRDAFVSDDTRAALCARRANGEWRTTRALPGLFQAHALFGSTALLQRYSDDSGLVTFDLETNVATPLPAREGLSRIEILRHSPSIASDRTIWSLVEVDPRVPVRGPLFFLWRDGRLVQRTVPDEAVAIGLLDATRVVAAGATSDKLWVSSDGGARFEPLPLPLPVDAAPVALLDAAEDSPPLLCGARGCLVDAKVFVGWHRPTGAELVVAAETAESGLSGVVATPPRERRAMQCARDAISRPALAQTGAWVAAPWGRYRVEARSSGASAVSLAVSWRLEATDRAAARSHSAAANAASLGVVSDTSAVGVNDGWTVAFASDRFAIVERCLAGVEVDLCERYVAHAERSIERVETSHDVGRVEVTMSGPSQTVAALSATGVSRVRMAWLFDETGRVLARKPVTSGASRGFTAALARRGARVGLLAPRDVNAAASLAFVPIFDGASLAAATSEAVTVGPWTANVSCATQRVRDAWTIVDRHEADELVMPIGASGRWLRRAQLTLEVSPVGEVCVRAIDWQQTRPETRALEAFGARSAIVRLESLRVVASESLHGTARTSAADTPVSCAVRAP